MDKQNVIKTTSEELINKIVDGATIEVVAEGEMNHVNIKVGDDAPTLIGRHGETLRSIQKILEVIIFKQTGKSANIVINVNDFREKQVERLQYIADQAVAKVQERQSPTYLRSFSSYERRIMHEYIATKYPELSSYSVGEGRDRRLVVDLKRAEGSPKPAAVEMESKPDVEDDEISIEV